MPDNSKQRQPWQRYLAEFIGTFAIVFAGCGAIITNYMTSGAISHVGICVTFGAVVAIMIYALGPISAAHFNPAVTIGFAVARRFPWRYVPRYITAQCLGAICGSGMLYLLYPRSAGLDVHYGATMTELSFFQAFGFEVVMTFFLMLTIMAIATDRRAPVGASGLAIGMAVMLCALFGGPLTGASMNPARSIGPALFGGHTAITALPLYLLSPPVGAIIAAIVFEIMRDGNINAQFAPADLSEAMKMESGLSRAKPQ